MFQAIPTTLPLDSPERGVGKFNISSNATPFTNVATPGNRELYETALFASEYETPDGENTYVKTATSKKKRTQLHNVSVQAMNTPFLSQGIGKVTEKLPDSDEEEEVSSFIFTVLTFLPFFLRSLI